MCVCVHIYICTPLTQKEFSDPQKFLKSKEVLRPKSLRTTVTELSKFYSVYSDYSTQSE